MKIGFNGAGIGDVLLASSINTGANMVGMIRYPHNAGRKAFTEMTYKCRSKYAAVRRQDLGSERIKFCHSIASLTGKFSFMIRKCRTVALSISKVP